MNREEAIHILENLKPTNTNSTFDAYVIGEALTMAVQALRENNHGEWIKNFLGIDICSKCGEPMRDRRVNHINFCNCCGADMRGGANERL